MKRIKKEFVFTGTPAVPSCHASTIVKTTDGSMVCAWFAGTCEKDPDVGIWYTVCKNGSWNEPKRIPCDRLVAHWNPVLFQKKDGTVCLFYKVGETIAEWKTMLVTFDADLCAQEPRELIAGDTSGGRGPVKNKPIYASNGTILAPGSTEVDAWLPFVDICDENGEWNKVRIPSDERVKLIQPSLWESKPGHIHALMRSNGGKIYRSDSADFGKTWCQAYPTSMPNNNSGLDCVMSATGTLVLVCNPVDADWGARTPLSVFTSSDNGTTFEEALRLETEAGEYSYPAVICCDNKIYVSYTHKRTAIAVCELAW